MGRDKIGVSLARFLLRLCLCLRTAGVAIRFLVRACLGLDSELVAISHVMLAETLRNVVGFVEADNLSLGQLGKLGQRLLAELPELGQRRPIFVFPSLF